MLKQTFKLAASYQQLCEAAHELDVIYCFYFARAIRNPHRRSAGASQGRVKSPEIGRQIRNDRTKMLITNLSMDILIIVVVDQTGKSSIF